MPSACVMSRQASRYSSPCRVRHGGLKAGQQVMVVANGDGFQINSEREGIKQCRGGKMPASGLSSGGG